MTTLVVIITVIGVLIGGIAIGMNLNKSKPDQDTVARQSQWNFDEDIDE